MHDVLDFRVVRAYGFSVVSTTTMANGAKIMMEIKNLRNRGQDPPEAHLCAPSTASWKTGATAQWG